MYLQSGKTALHMALEENKPEICYQLLEGGADPSVLDKVGGVCVWRCDVTRMMY